MTRDRSGFTLLEVLIVLTIVGLLLAALSSGVRFGLTAITAQTRLSGHDEDLVTLDHVARKLISRATTGSELAETPFHGEPHAVRFTALLSVDSAAMSSGALDITIRVDRLHRLVLGTQPHYTKGGAAQEAGSVVVLAEAVDRLDIDYESARPAGTPSWQPDWTGEGLPDLVRLHVVLLRPGKTRLPDIVASTRLRSRPL